MKYKRLFALLLLTLLLLRAAVPLWGGIQTARQGSYIISSPYSLYGLDCLRENGTGREWSLYPYAHYNGTCRLPMQAGDPLEYSMNMVRYTFLINEDALTVASVELYTQNNWNRLYEKDGKLYTERTDRSWPFRRKRLVCALSEEIGFYAPIRLAGLEGCGVLTLSVEDPGDEGEITVYVPMERGWEKAAFVLPDGTETERINGCVHRRRDTDVMGYSADKATGQLELWLADGENGFERYDVLYSKGELILSSGIGDGQEKPGY